jgi:hypothetical protein
MTPDKPDLIGHPIEDVPKRDPDYYCNARKSSDGAFEGYCEARAGAGTDHLGKGRCQWHGGATPRGEDSPHFKHGLFSDHLSEEDRETMEALEEYENEEKLEELINWRLARLRRYLRRMDSNERESFFDKFDAMVQEARKNGEPGLSAKQIKELGRTLSQNNRAAQQEIDLVRKLIKDHNKIVDGEDINLGWREALASATEGDDGAE